ncbi:MAG: hypothetical protein IJW37_04255 [Lachnospiraceae bacterium]|nr:hypothetical protein [Lachnospiraceae bacterium]
MVGDYAYAQVVKSVTVAEDGMSATVEVFNDFVDGANYAIKVKGYDEVTMVASVGVPARMELVAKDKNPVYILTTGVSTELTCKFYDANDVDVTSTIPTNTISYKLEKASTNGTYYLASNKLTIKDNTVSVVVIANYRGRFEDGKIVGALEAKCEFIAVDAAAVVPVSVSAYNLDGDFSDGVTHSLQLQEVKKLELKLNHSDNQNADKIYANGSQFNSNVNELITITAVTPDVADIAGENIQPHKAGVAQFYVNYKTKVNGNWVETPFAVIEIEVLENAYLNSVAVNNTTIFVGTADQYVGSQQAGFSKANINLLAYDQRGNRFNFGEDMYVKDKDGNYVMQYGNKVPNITIKCLSEGYGNGVDTADLAEYPILSTWGEAQYWDKKSDDFGISVDAVELRDYFADKNILTSADDGEYITLDYEITFKGMKSYFSVTVQEPSGNANDNYLDIKPSSTYVDITRKNADGAKDQKTITFEVFEKNNGVNVDTVEIAKYNASAATAGAYQFKILKDGNDITSDSNFTISVGKSDDYPYSDGPDAIKTNKVTINMSGTKTDDNIKAATGDDNAVLPDYTKGGAGVYTFALYKWELVDGNLIAVQQLGSDATAVLNSAGEYTIDVNAQRKNSISVITAAEILKCFTIKDTNGNPVVDPYTDVIGNYKYYVNYSAPVGASYVYVKEIVFYENIGGSVYVSFTVPVDVTLER